MAVNIITSFGQLYLSAALPDTVDISTQDENGSVVVKLYLDGDAVFENTLSAFGHTAKFSDIRSIIEMEMRKSGSNVASCYIAAEPSNSGGNDDDATDPFKVILSEFDIANPAAWLASHFLTTCSSFLVAPGDAQELSWYAATNEQVTHVIEAMVLLQDDTITSVSWTQSAASAGTGDVTNETISVDDVISHFASSGQLLMFTVYRGDNRCISFYVMEDSHNLHFRFRNAFDVTEYLNINGVSKNKVSMDAAEGVILHTTVKYDFERKEENDVESELLTFMQTKWLGQFLTSKHIEVLCDDGQWRPVLVDGSAEPTDSKNEVNHLKFTWKFTKNIATI